jgi:hypothetical protein
MPDEYYTHDITNDFDSSVHARELSYDSSESESEDSSNDSGNGSNTTTNNSNTSMESNASSTGSQNITTNTTSSSSSSSSSLTSSTTSSATSSSASSSVTSATTSAASSTGAAAASTSAVGGAAAATSAVTGAVVAVAAVASGAVAVPGLTPVQPTIDTPTISVIGNTVSYDFMATYVSAGSLIVHLQNLEDDRTNTIDLTTDQPSNQVLYADEAGDSAVSSQSTSTTPTYHYACKGYFDKLLSNKNYGLKITIKGSTSVTSSLFTTTFTTHDESENAQYTPTMASLSKSVADTTLHFAFDAVYYQETSAVVSMDNGVDPVKKMTTDLSLDSAHLTANSTESKKEYGQHVEGDFVGLKPGSVYSFSIVYTSAYFADVSVEDELVTTLSFFQPQVVESSLYTAADSVTFSYQVRYVEQTVLSFVITPDGATPLTYSETLPLSDATLTDQKDGSGHAIHSYLFASKISGLTQEVTYPYTLHAESTDFTGDIEKGTVTTKPDSIPVIITLAKDVLSISHEKCINYTFQFKYVEATSLKVSASYGSEVHSNNAALALDPALITTETDAKGRTYYATTISGSFNYVNPETKYTISLVSSSDSYASEEIFNGTITTLSSVKPSISVDFAPDYGSSQLVGRVSITDPNSYLTSGKLYAKIIGTPTSSAAAVASNITDTPTEGEAGDYYNTTKTQLTRMVYLNEPYTDIQAFSLTDFDKGYLLRLAIWGVDTYVPVGGSGESSDPQLFVERAIYY